MKSRKSFLRRATAAGVSLAFAASAKPADARETAPAARSPRPEPARKPPSETARAQAASMRRFDAKLTDAELDTIARGIDGAAAGAVLGGGKHPLRDGEEPVTTFVVKP